MRRSARLAKIFPETASACEALTCAYHLNSSYLPGLYTSVYYKPGWGVERNFSANTKISAASNLSRERERKAASVYCDPLSRSRITPLFHTRSLSCARACANYQASCAERESIHARLSATARYDKRLGSGAPTERANNACAGARKKKREREKARGRDSASSFSTRRFKLERSSGERLARRRRGLGPFFADFPPFSSLRGPSSLLSAHEDLSRNARRFR